MFHTITAAYRSSLEPIGRATQSTREQPKPNRLTSTVLGELTVNLDFFLIWLYDKVMFYCLVLISVERQNKQRDRKRKRKPATLVLINIISSNWFSLHRLSIHPNASVMSSFLWTSFSEDFSFFSLSSHRFFPQSFLLSGSFPSTQLDKQQHVYNSAFLHLLHFTHTMLVYWAQIEWQICQWNSIVNQKYGYNVHATYFKLW